MCTTSHSSLFLVWHPQEGTAAKQWSARGRTHLVQQAFNASSGLTFDAFSSDEPLQRAFVRSLEIIGEATKKLPIDFRAEYPDVEWRSMAGRPAGNAMAGGWGYESPGYGLTWWLTIRDGERFFAHSGSVGGYTTFVMGNRTRGFGVAFLTNGNRAHPHLVRPSNLALDLLAEELGESR